MNRKYKNFLNFSHLKGDAKSGVSPKGLRGPNFIFNPILDGVRAYPILDGAGAKKPPRVNSAI